MENIHNPDGVSELLETSISTITAKNGESAGRLASAVLVAFAANSSNLPDKDTKITDNLVRRIQKGEFGISVTHGYPSFTWTNARGQEQRLIEVITNPTLDLDNIFLPQGRELRPIWVRDTELSVSILLAASQIHERIGHGPSIVSKNIYCDPNYRKLRGHLARATFRVAQAMSLLH